MLRIKVREAELGEEIFTSVAWIRAFNINEPIYAELCHEFYLTYEFNEVLGLYQAAELDEDVFNVYFEGGLRSDEHFNAQEYWLSISREENLGRMEIRQDAIEQMEYRQSYHWDRYQGVFEHMAGVYSVPLQGAYNPPGYAQPYHYKFKAFETHHKALEFMSAVSSRFPPSNNQLIKSSNLRNQATIQDGRVTVQQIQGRQTQVALETEEMLQN
ncbi:hypothetical protein Tco_1217698 [Tanacetum coccineum]